MKDVTVDKEHINEDHKKKLEGLDETLTEGIEDFEGVYKYEGKPGLDIKQGKYKILGTVSAGNIYIRKGPGTNIAPESCGYHVEEIETGKRMYMTKHEGVMLAYEYGMVNAYIIYSTKKRKDSEGNVIKIDKSIYLQPFPAKKQSFTTDDRLVSVFELDENGKVKEPVNLLIDLEMCTVDLNILLQKLHERRSKNTGKRQRGVGDKRKRRVLELEAEISKSIIVNPFKKD